jgi:hypothetical protein|tara:strand:- start:3930 stop:4274 length:345 start_codon:yes stop_codon:yes gene_type:complete
MDLAMRDHKIFQMKAELENRKKTLCAKRRELATNTRENVFLIEVANDYDRYNKHIISQREKQMSFFRTLNQYIDNITGELQLTDGKLKESKLEQREIMKEMEHLKNDLDNLVTN